MSNKGLDTKNEEKEENDDADDQDEDDNNELDDLALMSDWGWGNIQDNWLCRSSHNAIEMCCYSMTVQKMVPFVSKHVGAQWTRRAA